MSAIWVDTDFGFDDLWALLLLRYLDIEIAGVSLVSGNAPLPQVCRNACGARQVFGCEWPLYRGAAQPLERTVVTAQHVLGETGMQSRGLQVPQDQHVIEPALATDAMCRWLEQPGPRRILALGPLTNLALLCNRFDNIAHRIDSVIWLGGSSGRGNQTPSAEFNAVADPAAVAQVLTSGIRLDIIDLELCRRVSFNESQMPDFGSHKAAKLEPLLRDLLGGYLDIALQRGRQSMAIYDPLAALALARPALVDFSAIHMQVHTTPGDNYGRTEFRTNASPNVRLATDIDADATRQICMDALTAAALTGENSMNKNNV